MALFVPSTIFAHNYMTNTESLQPLIQAAFADRTLLQNEQYKQAVLDAVALVDAGTLRVAQPSDSGWQVNEWVKQAILMYFGVMPMGIMQEGPEQYYDKIPLKTGMQEKGIRTVPGSIIRHGAYVSKGVICMPSFINIGAYVDEGTMVDTWATVGSCAQIGKHVHLSGGVGIGGVLEPLQTSPVIIEDNAFIGSRCIVVEGVIVEREAVLGANVVLTQSTKIIDVSGSEPVEYKGRVPARSVVIPGSYTKQFAAGEYQVNCALIIGQRKASTDTKTSLNDALRDFGVSV
jgi:2,3,4,5-tetrahydropyridine-2,6-dicarboxylate N-succinyltransferase